MNASWAASASTASPRTTARAVTVRVVPDREKRCTALRMRGTTRTPNSPASTRNAAAMSTVEVTTPTVTASPVTTLTTTVRMISPSTSSATAAPSTMRASTVARAWRSPNTRAVRPTLVAVRAAPRKMAVSAPQPRAMPAPVPAANGATTPMTATSIDARPTRPSSARSISIPTWTNSSRTPISARMPRLVPRSPPSSTRPSADGPMTMPARISPSTAGIPRRSATSAASLAAATTINRSRSSRARSMVSTAPSTTTRGSRRWPGPSPWPPGSAATPDGGRR